MNRRGGTVRGTFLGSAEKGGFGFSLTCEDAQERRENGEWW